MHFRIHPTTQVIDDRQMHWNTWDFLMPRTLNCDDAPNHSKYEGSYYVLMYIDPFILCEINMECNIL